MNLFNFFGRQKRQEKPAWSNEAIEKINRYKIEYRQCKAKSDAISGGMVHFADTTVDGKKYLLMLDREQFLRDEAVGYPQGEMTKKRHQDTEMTVFNLLTGAPVLTMHVRQSKKLEADTWETKHRVQILCPDIRNGADRADAGEWREGLRLEGSSTHADWQVFEKHREIKSIEKVCPGLEEGLGKVAPMVDKFIAQNPDAKNLYQTMQNVHPAISRRSLQVSAR